jgi:hypothetical protein
MVGTWTCGRKRELKTSRCSRGVGIPDITESKRALDFINKLDPRRYRGMHSQMRNLAVRGRKDAYPATLPEAFRTASGWINEDSGGGIQTENNSAFLADTFFVTKIRSVHFENYHQVRKHI